MVDIHRVRVNKSRVKISSSGWWILKRWICMNLNKGKVKLLSWWVYMYSGW